MDDMADGSQIVPLMVEHQLVSDPSQVLVRGQVRLVFVKLDGTFETVSTKFKVGKGHNRL